MTTQVLYHMPRTGMQALLDALRDQGYRCIGPRVRDNAIVYDSVCSVDDFPVGYRDRQGPGEYRLAHQGDQRMFAWANGAQALKPQTFAPQEVLWRTERDESGTLRFHEVRPLSSPTAVIGVRACDLAALRIQEKVFLENAKRDPYFAVRRDSLFIVAVDCSDPSSSCFCASTGDGPQATSGYDLALTELDGGFAVRIGSQKGEKVAEALPLEVASDAHHYQVGRQRAHAVKAQTRALPDGDLADELMARLEHPRWDDIAQRCLSCGNCTMVCPTCFCHKETETAQLNGERSEHLREWDSCFTQQHSYIHGFVLRDATKFRYRQWLTHKLATWHDQFGSSGCVGCGRCITWCPVGIDVTAEVAAIVSEAES